MPLKGMKILTISLRKQKSVIFPIFFQCQGNCQNFKIIDFLEHFHSKNSQLLCEI